MRVAFQFYARVQLAPLVVFRDFRGARAGVDRGERRVVAGEEARVDVEAVHDAGHAELDDAPVVSRHALAAGLPAVHPFAVVVVLVGDEDGIGGVDQAFLGAEEVVGGVDDAGAEAGLLEAQPLVEGV